LVTDRSVTSVPEHTAVVKVHRLMMRGHSPFVASPSTPVDVVAAGRVGVSGGRPVWWTPGLVDARSGDARRGFNRQGPSPSAIFEQLCLMT
jgi:hypothetical protein